MELFTKRLKREFRDKSITCDSEDQAIERILGKLHKT